MNKKWKLGVGIAVAAVAVIAVAAVFLRHGPIIDPADHPCVVSIEVTVGQNGETYDCDIPEGGISGELNDALVSRFLDTEMRGRLLPPPQTYTVSDDSVYITVKVLREGSSMRVNLCTAPDYNSAQFGDTHYHIVDYQELYQEVYGLLAGVIPAYAVKR